MNKIYTITRIGHTDYDEFSGMTIVAENEKQVREIAQKNDHDAPEWLDDSIFEVSEVSTEKAGVVMQDYHAG